MNAYEKKMNNDALTSEEAKRFEEHYGATSPQYRWLQQDLAKVDRTKTPWVVVFTHRPIYHTSPHHFPCSPGGDWYGCEFRNLYAPLYEKHKVDLVMSGHAHHYQRSKPMINGAPAKHGPRYIVCGTGGFSPLDPAFPQAPPAWMGYRQNTQYGYCRFQVHNATHLNWEFVGLGTSASAGGPPVGEPKVIDQEWVVK